MYDIFFEVLHDQLKNTTYFTAVHVSSLSFTTVSYPGKGCQLARVKATI